ncbi:NAD-dependent epimerase/dehydratase family protein [Listeria fleischmannii]|uniref:NAD-dependent epimerase/dehydratase family protein n=1 Tax=Listeria fleischmannii TaxID=1069827 RepID=A0A841YGK5_9LIST|nr:NAD-dependent epimerase/dehydratase family protein [Listeria fleischmannii]EIA19938.1 NAD dependent epimerase/dehydratase family protein [Listeria fleischmannii subsp. coloradonensis]MBC1399441.1 NAD-dependent epimerase/dehydratase family protein [Listeria fleischmannii]MBC1427831.1 NAD-dependent epimerase/dehydratase family protein [Listeria fleischmannii]STY46642.1 Putative NADH-flavin reductase [Listeria fleischmannii subsp. coloradonensis]
MKILVLGGTRFFGKRLVELLLEDGHRVTVATRGKADVHLPEGVRHLTLNREKREDMFQLAREHFDVIYDNICFSPQDALYLIQAFKGQKTRLIYTSSLSVYGVKGRALLEEDFDSLHYEIILGDRLDFDYGEGKRLGEAVYFQKADFDVAAVRFPIVLGVQDYTKRLQFHTSRILKGTEIGIQNEEAEIGFIEADEAARFLVFIGTKSDFKGPINASSDGTLKLYELIQLLETLTEKKAHITDLAEADDENESPFDIPKSYYLDNSKAKALGFVFQNVHDWLPVVAKEQMEMKDFK